MRDNLQNSDKEQKELMKSLEKRFLDLDARLSASGPTVEVPEMTEPLYSESFVVTFPRKRNKQ